MARPKYINWIFGRGLSIACNLSWSAPKEWQSLSRSERIKRIKSSLLEEMDAPSINSGIIKRFLGILSYQTCPDWRNRFITTNWDDLLQREIRALNLDIQPSPPWMADNAAHVFHLNGTVEELKDNSNRSPFLLEEDSADQRCFTPEANIAYTRMLIDRVFVVVGMSFECDTDRFLLSALSGAEDFLPIGESVWVVVNRNPQTLAISCSRIKHALPNAEIKSVCADFSGWIDDGMKEIQACGAIAL